MRAAGDDASLSPEQQRAAASGQKALMPIAGRPFLDFVLTAIAAAGVIDVALVVAPVHDDMLAAYPDGRGPDGVRVSCVVQAEPRGTADAVLSAQAWVGDAPFLVMNGDNVYPAPALTALVRLDGPGLAGFGRGNLVATSNIPAERVAAFALVEADATGALLNITEKPGQDAVARVGDDAMVSMNLWRFDAAIFDPCRDVPVSPRGEFELPAAVMLARSRGVRFDVVRAAGPVLDLSRRDDVAEVTKRLVSA
jgi:glucose-1-phosphate thymidylyltransferase